MPIHARQIQHCACGGRRCRVPTAIPRLASTHEKGSALLNPNLGLGLFQAQNADMQTRPVGHEGRSLHHLLQINACTVHDSTRQHRPSVSLQTREIEKEKLVLRLYLAYHLYIFPGGCSSPSSALLLSVLAPSSFSFPPSPTLTQSPSRCNLASGDYFLRPFRSTRKSEREKEKGKKEKEKNSAQHDDRRWHHGSASGC